jgi:hypothetical protein
MLNPLENPLLNEPFLVADILPTPCDCIAPLQHFMLYTSSFTHKQPILGLPFGDEILLVGPK